MPGISFIGYFTCAHRVYQINEDATLNTYIILPACFLHCGLKYFAITVSERLRRRHSGSLNFNVPVKNIKPRLLSSFVKLVAFYPAKRFISFHFFDITWNLIVYNVVYTAGRTSTTGQRFQWYQYQ